MKKWIALALCLAMLLSATALGEGVSIRLRDLTVQAEGESVDLTGLEAQMLLTSTSSDSVGLRISCNAEDQTLVTFGVACLGGKLLAGYGATELSELYSVDLSTLQALASETAMTVAMLRVALPSISEGIASVAAAMRQNSRSTALGRIEIPQDWVTGNRTADYDGVACEGIDFTAPQEISRAVLKALAEFMDETPMFEDRDFEYDSYWDYWESENVQLNIGGGLYSSDVADYLHLTLQLVVDGDAMTLDLDVSDAPLAQGEQFGLDLCMDVDDMQLYASADVLAEASSDDAWLQLDPAEALDVIEALTSEEGIEALEEKLERDSELIMRDFALSAMHVINSNRVNALME